MVYLKGPFLFLLYVNDIQYCSRKLKFFLFADDTNILYSHDNLKTLELIVNTELHNLLNWLTANKLTLNRKKRLNYLSQINGFLIVKKIRMLPLNIRIASNILGY